VDIRINPSETWRLGPTPVPRLPNVVAPPEHDDDDKEQP
jgi:hypothetical protein